MDDRPRNTVHPISDPNNICLQVLAKGNIIWGGKTGQDIGLANVGGALVQTILVAVIFNEFLNREYADSLRKYNITTDYFVLYLNYINYWYIIRLKRVQV